MSLGLSDPAARTIDAQSVAEAGDGRHTGFPVRLRNFTGPFDLLLQLISSRRLDVTEVALHQVTDDFLAHMRLLGDGAGLEQTTEFLVIAATLLDLKAARLLPRGDVDDTEDLALLEARDLIFARLLQYRAYQQVGELFRELEAAAMRRYPRSVALEDRFAALLPEVLLGVDPPRFAEIAAAVFRPAPPPPTVSLTHLHAPRVSVAEQAQVLEQRLHAAGAGVWTSFATLVADCEHTGVVVARFLALLELFRRAAVVFDQPEPLTGLQVSWSGSSSAATDPDADLLAVDLLAADLLAADLLAADLLAADLLAADPAAVDAEWQ